MYEQINKENELISKKIGISWLYIDAYTNNFDWTDMTYEVKFITNSKVLTLGIYNNNWSAISQMHNIAAVIMEARKHKKKSK